MDLVGQKFGKLTVIKYDNDRSCIKTYPSGIYKINYWICQCDCENIKSIAQNKLTSGNTKSCGCLQKEARHFNHKKYNKYELSKDGKCYLIEIDFDNIAIIDKDDYEKVSKYYWRLNDSGYAIHIFADGSSIRLHRLILDLNDDSKDNIVVDHINRNKLDNRKLNLRETTQHKNSFNNNIGKNNKTGYIGISYLPESSKVNPWQSRIMYNWKTIYLGSFPTIEKAIRARLLAEIKYFGEDFAPQRHLFPLFLNKGEYNMDNYNKQIFIINGSGGVGKDTFVSLVSNNIATMNFSSVDKVKEIARDIGWLGEKTEKDRKFLSDLKLLCTDYNDMPFNSMRSKVAEFLNNTKF